MRTAKVEKFPSAAFKDSVLPRMGNAPAACLEEKFGDLLSQLPPETALKLWEATFTPDGIAALAPELLRELRWRPGAARRSQE